MDKEPEDLVEALYIALDRLEALDPIVIGEPWYLLIEREADATVRLEWIKHSLVSTDN